MKSLLQFATAFSALHSKRTCLLGVSGFSLTELLTVIAIISVLTTLLFAAINTARNRGDSVTCVNNARQLVLAWQLYAQDHDDRLTPNIDGMVGGFTNWVAGNMKHNEDLLDTALLVDRGRSLLAQYVTQALLYKCPADETKQVRSISMNCRLNPVRAGEPPRWIGGFGLRYNTFYKSGDIITPSRVFVTVDESEENINDGYFAVDMSNTGNNAGLGTPNAYYVIDLPGLRHGPATTFSFGDGHVRVKRWSRPKTFATDAPPKRHVAPPNEDALWLQEHSTYLE